MYDFDRIINRKNTHCEKWDGMQASFGSADLLPFWVADMDFQAAPEILSALRKVLDQGVLGYPIMYEEAKKAVCSWQAARHNWDIPIESVGFVPGVVTGLVVALYAFTQPGDSVIIQTPVYPPFHSLITNNNRKLIYNPLIQDTNGYRMDFDHLESIMGAHVRAILISNPHNPVGRVWDYEELTTLVDICARHNVIIFSDEIHQDIVFSEFKHTPVASVSDKASRQTVTLVAPSKTFNIPGLVASASIIPDASLRETFSKTADNLHLAQINLMGIAALEAAYTRGEPWLETLIPYLQENRDYVREFLKNRLPKTKMHSVEGSFLCWIDFGGYGLANDELQNILIRKAGVALSPGIAFGTEGDGFARLNIGCPKSVLVKGLERIAQAIEPLSR